MVHPGKADLGENTDCVCISGIFVTDSVLVYAVKPQGLHIYTEHKRPGKQLLDCHFIEVMELVVIAKQRTIKQILRVSETGRAELYFVHFFRCFYIRRR